MSDTVNVSMVNPMLPDDSDALGESGFSEGFVWPSSSHVDTAEPVWMLRLALNITSTVYGE
jgi:hypothetical protein